ncbi:MAG: hypothetical protein NTW16_04135 [Bacteroidetes bacterium]|nr:hypothetical protein [Bacteroidota bacterium]
MINLLDKTHWNNSYPWGSIINPDTGKEICINDKLVTYHSDGSVHFACSNAWCPGWKMDKNWNIVNTSSQWSVGAIISKDEYRTHFGKYHFIFRLPNFRGAWPAIWFLDLHPTPPAGDGMGMPPEIDVFEQFRKDAFLTRFHISHTFHQGPTYLNNTSISKTYWKLTPLDLQNIDLVFTWFPTVNLIMNAGLGLDWKPNVGKFEDFVVVKAEYQPL